MQRLTFSLAPLALAAFGLTPAATAADPGPITAGVEIPLETKIYRNWKFRLPAEAWKNVGKAIEIPGDGKSRSYKAQLDGTQLMLDSDGDGELDTKIEEEGGVVLLFDGESRSAIRVRSQPDWSYAPASVQRGKIHGTKVSFIDQNNNGRFDDYGQDAMIVGAGRTASFLSKVIRVKDQLHTLTISADGSKVSCAPYEGGVGALDFKLLSKGKVLAAVVKSTDGQLSFDLSRAKGALQLPAGEYRIHSGLLSFGGNTVRVHSGRSQPIQIEADSSKELRLGGPAKVEFAYKFDGSKFHFSPDDIWYYGRGGEEYSDWQPLGSSPKIAIFDRVKKEKVAEAVFPPNC